MVRRRLLSFEFLFRETEASIDSSPPTLVSERRELFQLRRRRFSLRGVKDNIALRRRFSPLDY